VNAHLGSPDYARLRVGVGRPPAQVDPADYVLGRFPRADDARLEGCVERAAEAARRCCELGALKAMNEVNRRREPAG
jgi:PTH1 family peptidyl-tRNA hydrolase